MKNNQGSLNSPFARSEELLKRAQKSIPLGTQTFSKSFLQYPHGVSPFYVSRAEGSHIWDVDGNKFVDFVSGLCAIILGYKDEDVDAAVRAQMVDGNLFSLPHPIEIKVSEKLCEMVPCAEMVRFGKNGSDVTSAAIRLARAHTRRDHIISCGYHGWQDWFIGTTSRKLGVPKAVCELTHTFPYNDINALDALFRKWPESIACVIMEPMNSIYPIPGFLEGVQELCRKNGALLVFDEMITGFRYSRGGAQEFFSITPDLATFGKALANGYPLSAIVGRADVMGLMEEIFFSFTMGGETLSLAAAAATLDKINREPVIETITKNGEDIALGLKKLLDKYQINNLFKLSGHPSWQFLSIMGSELYTSWEIKTFFLQEMFSRRVLILGNHNLSYSHKKTDIKNLLQAYDEVFALTSRSISEKTLKKQLRCKTLTPLFSVRGT